MKEFGQLLIGSSFVAMVAFASWLIGVLMGVLLVKLAAAGAGRRTDVDDLLQRERVIAQKASRAASAAAPGA